MKYGTTERTCKIASPSHRATNQTTEHRFTPARVSDGRHAVCFALSPAPCPAVPSLRSDQENTESPEQNKTKQKQIRSFIFVWHVVEIQKNQHDIKTRSFILCQYEVPGTWYIIRRETTFRIWLTRFPPTTELPHSRMTPFGFILIGERFFHNFQSLEIIGDMYQYTEAFLSLFVKFSRTKNIRLLVPQQHPCFWTQITRFF